MVNCRLRKVVQGNRCNSVKLFFDQYDSNDLTQPYTAQKMKFSIKDLFAFTEEILKGKLHFLCSV